MTAASKDGRIKQQPGSPPRKKVQNKL